MSFIRTRIETPWSVVVSHWGLKSTFTAQKSANGGEYMKLRVFLFSEPFLTNFSLRYKTVSNTL